MTRKNRKPGRRSAPPRRAVVGGVLISVSALGVFGAHRGAERTPTDRFVVATHDIAAGTVVEESDLGSIALDLPDDIAAVGIGDVDHIVGRVASGDIAELELISENDVYDDAHFIRTGATRLTLDLPPARAMHEVVTAGDTVSVLSTDPQGTGTVVLSDSALVLSSTATSGDSIGTSGVVRVVLAVTDPDEVLAVTDASVNSELTLVLVEPGGPTTTGDTTSGEGRR